METITREENYYIRASSFIKPDIGFHAQFIHNNYRGLHMHDFYELIYVVSGEITHSFGGKLTKLSPGDFVFVPKDTEHGFVPPKECYNRDLLVNEELFEGICALLPSAKSLLFELQGSPVKIPLKEVYRLEKLINAYQAETVITVKRCKAIKILLDVLSLALYANKEQPVKEEKKEDGSSFVTAKIIATLNKNFNLPNCLDVVKFLNYSNSYLRKIFKKEIGCTMSDYLKKIRLSHVEYYLTTTNYSLGQIAEMVGIESLSYLNKIFKEEYGVTPIKYRNTHGKETPEQ